VYRGEPLTWGQVRESLAQTRHFPVTTVCIVLAIAASLWRGLKQPLDWFVVTGDAFWTEPWRLVLSILPHADFMHILFNAWWMVIFGKTAEWYFGWKWMIGFIALSAAVSSGLQFAIEDGGLGLSGVVYALFGYLWVLSRNDPVFFGKVTERTAWLFGGWFVFCFVATELGFMNVGNVAHGAGWLFGWLAGRRWVDAKLVRWRWNAAVAGLLLVTWIGGTVARPYVNLGRGIQREWYDAADGAWHQEDYAQALELFQRLAAAQPDDARAHRNLAITYGQLGRWPEALAAIRRARELDPGNAEVEGAYAWITAMADLQGERPPE
jgi:GlpG protein